MQKSFIITAGGVGKRMESSGPKQFLMLAEQPILMHTIAQIHAYDSTAQLIVTLPEDVMKEWQLLCEKHAFQIAHTFIAGGKERYHSVKNALPLCTGKYIAVHDGVRPFVSFETMTRLFQAMEENGAAIPVIPVIDSLRKVDGQNRNQAVNRSEFWSVQTPQVFEADLLRKAYSINYHEGITDDASLVEELGEPIILTPGNTENIKLTTPLDLILANALLEQKKSRSNDTGF
jgi:2-C-methyl-D-erythritol 4-phosphate cytidylyltransferase